MQRLLFFSLFSVMSLLCVAQVDPLGVYNRHVVANWSGSSYFQIGNYRVKGTPYLFGESFPGSIDYKGGKSITGVKVSYDLYNQRAGIDMKKGEVFEAEEGVDRFTIELPEKFGGKKLLFVNSDAFGNTNKTEYYNLLTDGAKVAFLKAYKIKLIPDPTNEMNKDIRVFDQYYEYYIFQKDTKQLLKVKLKERDIIKGTADTKEIKVFSKDNQIDFSKEGDVIELLNFYNTRS